MNKFVGVSVMKKTVDGLTVNVAERGEASGNAAVLFLHGWGSRASLFEGLIELAAKKYFVLAPDMPGFGDSDEPADPWDVGRYADFILGLLKPYSLKKLILVGHSFGGRVILKLCERELPFEIEKIILIDSAGIKPKKSLRQRLSLAAYKTGRRVMSLWPLKKIFPDAVEKMRKKRGSADYNAASPVMRQTLVKVVNEDLRHVLPSVKAPTLLIWGTADTATPLSDGELMEKLIPDAGLVKIEGAGHYSFLEAPEYVARVTASFLNI